MKKIIFLLIFIGFVIFPSFIYCKDEKGFTSAVEYTKKAKAYFDEGKYQEAIEFYQKANQIIPRNIYNLANMGFAYEALGKYEEAIKCYETLEEVSPNNYKIKLKLGENYSELGRYDEAVSYYKRALSLNPEDRQAYVNLGYSCCKKGKYEDGISAYEKALTLNCPKELNNDIGKSIKLAKKMIKERDNARIEEYISELEQGFGLSSDKATSKNSFGYSSSKDYGSSYLPKNDYLNYKAYNEKTKAAFISKMNQKIDADCRRIESQVPRIPNLQINVQAPKIDISSPNINVRVPETRTRD